MALLSSSGKKADAALQPRPPQAGVSEGEAPQQPERQIPRVGMLLVVQSCLAFCAPTDCSPPGSSVHGVLQARILEWVAMPSSRGSSQPRDQTRVSHTAGGFFTVGDTG